MADLKTAVIGAGSTERNHTRVTIAVPTIILQKVTETTLIAGFHVLVEVGPQNRKPCMDHITA